MPKFKKQHAIMFEGDNFRVEVVANFLDDNFGITVFDTYSGKTKPYLHLAKDTAKELIELLQVGLTEIEEGKKNGRK